MFKNFLSALFKKNTGLKNSAGLTLIELMVVVAIMMIMTAIVIVNYRPGNQQLALNRSASKLAQDIRRAQEMAMGSRVEGACDPITFRGRYGVKLSRDHTGYYILFADCNDSGNYDAGDEIIEQVIFESGIEFNKIEHRVGAGWDPTDPGLGEPTINILFSPPDPERTIFTGEPPLDNAPEQRLRLKLDGDRFKYIYTNNAGLIYVE